MPEFLDERLDNGLQVRVSARGRLPEVAIRLVLPAGADADPVGAGGTASLTAALLTEGAAGMGAQDVAEWLDHMGAGFSVTAGWDGCVVAAHGLVDGLDELLDFVSAIVLEPAFEPGEVERVRGERLDEIRRARDEPAELAAEMLIGGVFGEHPYGRPSRGTEESVSSLGPEDLRAFWNGRYRPREATMIVVGRVDPDHVLRAVESRFGGWSDGPEPGPPPAPPGPPPAAGRVLLLNRPASRQVELRVGAVGPARGAPDEIPALVANAVIGGLFASRLNWKLREEKGWTYGARSYFSPRKAPGPFVARAAVETGAAAEALSIMRDEVAGLVGCPPRDGEISAARDSLTRGLARRFETVSQVAAKAGELAIYGLPDDWWGRFAVAAASTTAEDAARAAGHYLRAADLVLAAVGDADGLAGPLEALGPVEVREAP